MKASEGKLDEARALFERQLAIVEETEARAPILTDLARTLWEKPGDSLAALPFLDEALDLAPDYLPAAVTMADIFFKEQQWEQAERRLSQVLRRMRGDAVESAKLYYRLAEVYEKLGRLDDGYRQLVEADRMMPGQLLVRLSLGENRFHAKKWREAATYLDGIAQHPEAAAYPEEVAQGLARAAQSELKLKRPERAVALYEAALGLSAEHRPSLRALADLALERGEKRQAVQYLRRLAESSGERAERAQLFEQMGDLYQGLEDPAEARRSYEAALGMISPVTEDHIPLLGKTLALQRDDGAVREAGETAQRLIDLEQDPTERAARRREAAMLLMGQGETARATEYLERALADNPTDEEALAGLATVYEQAGRLAEIEPFVARVLPGLAPLAADASVRARAVRAELWERLGTLARGKDDEAAIAAYDKAVEADTARLAARLALVELYGDRPRYRQVALDNHRALVAGDLTRATSLRALARAYADAGQTDWARCHFEMLALLGLADDDDRAFLDSHPAPLRNAEDPYAGTIEDADRGRSLAHPDARVMAEVFAAIWEGVPGLNAPTLESLGVDAQDKVSPLSELTIGKVYGQAAKALSNKRTSLYISWDSKLDAVVIAGTPPPSIVVGQRLVTGEDTAEMRFCIGRALELTRPEYILAATLAPKDFAQLFASVLKAFHPRHSRWRAGAQDAATEQAAKLKKALPYKVSKRLAELFQENDSTPFSSVRWRAVVIETGNRAGLLLCGDLQAAARVVMRELASGDSPPVDAALLREHAVKDGPLRALLRYAVSEDYFALRASLGIGVSRAAAA